MTLQTQQLERAFRYNSVDLPDPGAQYTPEEVRDLYSATYPEITSAAIEGPEQKENRLVYTFRRAVGTKGNGDAKASSPFEQWALVELFGHQRIAGLLTEQAIGGCHFLRVDVPQIDERPAFTKLYTQGAIYGVTFTDEATCRALVASLRTRPIDACTSTLRCRVRAGTYDDD